MPPTFDGTRAEAAASARQALLEAVLDLDEAAMAAYLEALPQCAETVSKMTISPEIPVTVLSAANATTSEIQERDQWVRQSKRGRHVQVENTGHWVHLERPEVIVEAVRELVKIT